MPMRPNGGVVDLHEGGVKQVDVEAGKSIQVGGHDGHVAETAHERHDPGSLHRLPDTMVPFHCR